MLTLSRPKSVKFGKHGVDAWEKLTTIWLFKQIQLYYFVLEFIQSANGIIVIISILNVDGSKFNYLFL